MRIKTEAIGKTFNGKEVLKNISLEIEENRISCFLGPNGVGKTTLLRILNLLERPSQGKIYYDGKIYQRIDRLSLQRRMVLVGQNPVMFDTSVYHNVSYGLRVRRMKDTKRKIKQALEMVKLSGMENRSALTLSGGEIQRVALARALVIKPEVSFLDEPTHNLDPLSKEIIEDLILRLKDESRRTIVLSTHDLLQAEKLSHKVYLLKEGKIIQEGKAREFFVFPSSSFSAEFLGIRNLFKGKLIQMNGISFLDLGKLKIEIPPLEKIKQKDEMYASLRPEEILVSSQPLVSSARNSFQGKVIKMENKAGLVELTADCGIPFTVVLTKRSKDDLNLELGKKVYLTFKASAVHLMDSG